jgi:hypothetical protein
MISFFSLIDSRRFRAFSVVSLGRVAQTQLDATKIWFFIVHALVDQQTLVTSSSSVNDAGPGLK